jgi:hypothetical protein
VRRVLYQALKAPYHRTFIPDIGENLVRLGERDDALGLVNRTLREINEMRYEFDEPFIVERMSTASIVESRKLTPLRSTISCGLPSGATPHVVSAGVAAPARPASRGIGFHGHRTRRAAARLGGG